MWGPVKSVEEIRSQRPPLIGNRRQGPDLSQLAVAVPRLWLKCISTIPLKSAVASIMPTYGFLFHDERETTRSLSSKPARGHNAAASGERSPLGVPDSAAMAAANLQDGERIFQRHLSAPVIDAGGATRWRGQFKRLPPDLTVGPYLHLHLRPLQARRFASGSNR